MDAIYTLITHDFENEHDLEHENSFHHKNALMETAI